MYWNNNSVSSSHLETLLSKEDVTLQELMDEEEILQECRSQNAKLIEYLIRSDVLEELVTLTTVEPEGDDYSKYKYPNIASELLTCDLPQLSKRLADDEVLMGKLYSFLESKAPLNPLLASFFSKTFSMLIGRTSEQNWYSYQLTCLQVLEFLKSKENCVSLLLKHLGTSAIRDLLFKLITDVEGNEMKQNVINWLDDQQLVQNIMVLFDPTIDSDVHCNAAELLCDIIRTARDNRKKASEQDRILDRIESPEIVSLLLDQMLKEPKCQTSIIGGISVLLALLKDDASESDDIECNRYTTPVTVEDHMSDSTEPSKVVLNTLKAIYFRLKDFHDILLNPPLKPAVNTTIGVLDPPLGSTRVEVARLLTVLVAKNYIEINKKLAELDTINVLLDLFFKYSWNNMLHAQVENFLACAFSSDISAVEGSEIQNDFLVSHILVKCRLLQRILDAWEDNETQQNVHKRPRRGYMGHLIKIANNIAQQAEKGPLGALLPEIIDSETFSKWKCLVGTKLAEINDTYKKCLGGVHPENSEDSGLQEVYSGYYQVQPLGLSYPEQLGSFQEEPVNENDEILNSSSDLILQKISFNINEDDLDQDYAAFEEICKQNYSTLDDDDGIDILNKKIETKSNDNLKSDWPENSENSSSDEDEHNERGRLEGNEDLQAEFAWPNDCDKFVPPLEDVSPWNTATLPSSDVDLKPPSPDMGWANFESAHFVADFSLNLTPDIRTTIATSVFSDIETVPLDLTPSDCNVNVNEMFSKGTESRVEMPQILSNVPITGVYTNIESITNAFKDFKLKTDKTVEESAPFEGERTTGTGTFASADDGKKENEPAEDVQVNSLHNSELSDDTGKEGTQKEGDEDLLDNLRFLSPQGLMTKCGQESDLESETVGDGFKLLQENVQSMPNDSNQFR